MDDLDLEPQSDSSRSLITLIVIMLLVLVWGSVIAPRMAPPPEPVAEKAEEAEKPTTSAAVGKPPKAPELTTAAPVQPKTATVTPVAPEPKAKQPEPPTKQPETPPEPEPELAEVTKDSELLSATFTNQGAALSRLVLKDYYLTPNAQHAARRARREGRTVDVARDGFPLLGQAGTEASLVLLPRDAGAAGTGPGAEPPELFGSRRFEKVADEELKVAFRTVFPGTRLEVTKTFVLPPKDAGEKGERLVTLDIQFRNLGSEPAEVPGYLLRGPGGLAAELGTASWKRGQTAPDENELKTAAALFQAAVATDNERDQVNVIRESVASVKALKDKGEPFNREGSILWSGLESNYFAAILVPRAAESQELKVWSGGARPVGELNATANIQVAPFKLAAAGAEGDRVVHRYRLYAGPKTLEALAPCGSSLEKMIESHWYDSLSSIMSWILRGSYFVIPNYGIAIIILTLIVRLVLHPLSKKSQTSMAKMQKLQPKVKELRDKFKTDKQRQQQEMMKLYKDYGVNPLGGCLPMLLQLPIFIGLYNMLRNSIELRHACFVPWWVEDLSQPDALFAVVNVLPIFSVIIMFIQQRMQPKSGDPQQQQTQKIMGYMMPAFLGWIFYSMPSGLNLYFVASMLIGVLEQRHIKKQLDRMGELKPVHQKTSKQARKAVMTKAEKQARRKPF